MIEYNLVTNSLELSTVIGQQKKAKVRESTGLFEQKQNVHWQEKFQGKGCSNNSSINTKSHTLVTKDDYPAEAYTDACVHTTLDSTTPTKALCGTCDDDDEDKEDYKWNSFLKEIG